MMQKLCAYAALIGCIALVGCDKKEAPAPASEPSAAPAAPVAAAPAVPAPEPVVDVASLPVEEQFEADAEKEITTANLEQQLDALEKELSAP